MSCNLLTILNLVSLPFSDANMLIINNLVNASLFYAIELNLIIILEKLVIILSLNILEKVQSN